MKKTNFIKKALAGFCALSLIATASGCSSTSSTSSSTSSNNSNSSSKKTLTVMISAGDYGPAALKKALTSAGNLTNVNVKFDVFPSDQFLDVVNTKLATGNADDIIIHNFGLTDVSAKDLAPLDGHWVSEITNTTKPLCISPIDNKSVLKAPFAGEGNMGILYNKKVLQQAGVNLPLKNYSDLIEACKKIKEKSITPIYLSNKEVWTAQIWLLGSMTSILEKDSTTVNKLISNQIKPQNIPALKKLFDNAITLKTNGYINSDYMSATDSMGQQAIAEGKAAFYCQMDSAYSSIAEKYSNKIEDVGMTYVPLADDASDTYVLYSASTNYLSAVKASKNLDLAQKFINNFITKDVMTEYYKAAPGSAPYKDLGYDLNMSPWNKEMKEYANNLRINSDFSNAVINGKAVLSPFYGRFNEQVQAMYSGVSAEKTLESWYSAYAQDAKARRVSGF